MASQLTLNETTLSAYLGCRFWDISFSKCVFISHHPEDFGHWQFKMSLSVGSGPVKIGVVTEEQNKQLLRDLIFEEVHIGHVDDSYWGLHRLMITEGQPGGFSRKSLERMRSSDPSITMRYGITSNLSAVDIYAIELPVEKLKLNDAGPLLHPEQTHVLIDQLLKLHFENGLCIELHANTGDQKASYMEIKMPRLETPVQHKPSVLWASEEYELFLRKSLWV